MRSVCRISTGDKAVECGPGKPLLVIGGPCVLESADMGLAIARTLRDACRSLGFGYVFKASFDKANRSSVASPRGPGLEKGLAQLAEIGRSLGVPTTTDVHEPTQAAPVAEAVHLLQIPAFLCRQTDLLFAVGRAAAERSRAVNVKKGQFLSAREMVGPVRKLAEAGCRNVMLTERGTFFGYHRLVNDFIGIGDMMDLDVQGGGPPVCFDVTHSTQLPGAGETTGGRPDRAPLLARAAVAAGVDAIFLECHPEPARAASDAATALPLHEVPGLLAALKRVRDAVV